MNGTGLKIFKLNIDGSFDEISYENIKEVFTIVNILAIYVFQKKTMYIWIGSNATQALKNHISNIRVLLKEEFPNFRIIRNFTFEMRDEPFEFFKDLNISKEELYEIIDYQEKVMLPTLNEIDTLKEKLDNFISREDYANAIKISEEIIVLAKKIEDDAVKTEHERLIEEIKSKFEDKKLVDEITEKALSIDKKFSKLIEVKEFLKAHQLIEEFEENYKSTYDLSQIPSVKELLEREKKIWKKEQERLIKTLNALENDLFLALKNLEIEKALNLMEKGKSLFANLINDEIKQKWKGFENDFRFAKQKVDLIEVCNNFLNEYNKLKNEFQFDTLHSKLNDLVEKAESLKLTDYLKKLNVVKKEINSAEDTYKTKLAKITELEKIIKSNQKNNLLDDTLKNCQLIIKIAKSINKSEVVKKYSEILLLTEEAIEKRRIFKEKQDKLRIEIHQIEKEIKDSLKRMDLSISGNLIEKSKLILVELVDDKIKDNWIQIEEIYNLARNLIQTVEDYSKNGILALELKSYKDSIENYKQIVNLIQEYNKQIEGTVT
ncbi:MAG: hypothetical protein ACFE8B_01310 [Candidatus Hermodarchaeota archaeon]